MLTLWLLILLMIEGNTKFQLDANENKAYEPPSDNPEGRRQKLKLSFLKATGCHWGLTKRTEKLCLAKLAEVGPLSWVGDSRRRQMGRAEGEQWQGPWGQGDCKRHSQQEGDI